MHNILKRLKTLLTITLLYCWMGGAILGIGIQFGNDTITAAGRGSFSSFFVKNDADRYYPVEIRVFVDQVPEELKDDPDLLKYLLVSPAQVLLRPNARQHVSMRWIGPKDLKEEITYWMDLTEIPIDIKKNIKSDKQTRSGTVKVIAGIKKRVYVVPVNSTEKLVLVNLEAVEELEQKDNKTIKVPKLKVTYRNDGNRHVKTNTADLVVDSLVNTSLKSLTIKDKKMGGTSILPNKTKSVFLDWPEEFPFGAVTGNLKGYSSR